MGLRNSLATTVEDMLEIKPAAHKAVFIVLQNKIPSQISALSGFLKDQGHYVEIFGSVDKFQNSADWISDKFHNTGIVVAYDSEIKDMWGTERLKSLSDAIGQQSQIALDMHRDLASWWDQVRRAAQL